jgi:ammonium transporter
MLAVLLTGLLALSPAFADDPKPPDKPTADAPKEAATPAPDKGDTAWMLVSTALVMFMMPGLALFYGGIVRRKNVLGTMMHSMVALAIIGVQWVLFGYCLAFGASKSGLIGWTPNLLGLNGVLSNELYPGSNIPIYVHCMYQGMFAIITPALISGALAERIRFAPYCVFIFLWSILVYCPLAHWVWAVDAKGDPAGWLGKMGALDFAGGTVVHVAAGVSGLAAILMLRKRIGYPGHAMHPNSVVLTLLGAGFLWFGWFGFNGGSGLGIGKGIAGAALGATQLGAAGAALTWMLLEWAHRGKPTALGFATGLVAGLVAITPASGFVAPWAAILIGVASGGVCYGMVALKPKLKYDDSLDAFGVHGIGGFLGAVLTGVFVSKALFSAGNGSDLPDVCPIIKDGSRFGQIMVQFSAAAVSVVFAFVATAALVKLIDATMGFCLTPEDETEGLDSTAHGEVGFDFGLTPEMAVVASAEPKSAAVPPKGGDRYTVVLDGAPKEDLMGVWSRSCMAGAEPSAEFRAVYPHVTTVQGNRFRFLGGDPNVVSQSLAKLFEKQLNRRIDVQVE